MNKLKIAAGLSLAVCLPALFFVAGNAVGNSDKKLFAADDQRHAAMIARSCGKAGRLVQDPFTNEFLCIWTNPDGSTLTALAPEHPYLDQVAVR